MVNGSKIAPMVPSQINAQHAVQVVPMGGPVPNQPLSYNQPMVGHQGGDLLDAGFPPTMGLCISEAGPTPEYRLPVPVHHNPLTDAAVQSNGAMASTSSGRGWRVINPVSPIELGKPASPTPAEAREQGLLGRNRIAKKSG